jgi:hypothetical protein
MNVETNEWYWQTMSLYSEKNAEKRMVCEFCKMKELVELFVTH